MLTFRLLRADEIDVRISSVNKWGVQLLLYKDARCDQNILDETVGAMNWQRSHSRDNSNCTVSIWDEDKNQWISKEDTGTDSYTEAEKGRASDSFKRACFNWGIGRELYTAPTMFVRAKDLTTLKEANGRWTCKDYFRVKSIAYTEDRKIAGVEIINTKTGTVLTFWHEKYSTTVAQDEFVPDAEFLREHGSDRITKREIKRLTDACEQAGENMTLDKALTAAKRSKVQDVTYTQYFALMRQLGAVA